LAALQQTHVAELRKFVHQQIEINLNSWKIEMEGAINTAVGPSRPESNFYWYVALAGNLLWAATALLAPPAAIAAQTVRARLLVAGEDAASEAVKNAARLAGENAARFRSHVITDMSFTGAAIGSGSVEKIARAGAIERLGAEDGKKVVRDYIGRQRANLEDLYKRYLRDTWANQLNGLGIWEAAGNAPEPLDVYDPFIWAQMFPGVAYDEERFNTLRNNARAKIESALADYNRQWHNYHAYDYMPHEHSAYALYAMGTLAIRGPFEPHLDFGRY